MEGPLYWYIENLSILTNIYTTALTTKQIAGKRVFNTAYYIIINKDGLTKENARIKQVLKENRYQESIIRKIFKRITNNHSFSSAIQQPQATNILEQEIRMSINLLFVEGTIEKLQA